MDYIEIIERLKKKDQRALEEIIHEYNQYVAFIVYAILNGRAAEIDMQGVINQVFFSLWCNADKIDTTKYTELKPYLGAIARNTAINEKNKLIQNLPLNEHIIGELNNSLSQAELREILCSALKQLSKHDQIVLIKYYFQGKPIRQISEEEHIPQATIKTNLRRGRAKLKTILEEEGFIYED